MEIQFILNGKMQTAVIAADTLLLDLLRSLGCYSVKRGCETSNCGLCTVWMNQKPVLTSSRSIASRFIINPGLQKPH